LRRVARRLRACPISGEYAVLGPEPGVLPELLGWHEEGVAREQAAAYEVLMREMYAGTPRLDLCVVAQAMRLTGTPDPLTLEVGCGNGYYFEILGHLLGRPIRYVGIDYSRPMLRLARRSYQEARFILGDATGLPFADRAFDVVLNGVSLMHIPRYEQAIAEARRVGREWWIFHTVPVLQRRETTFLSKRAYGATVVEVVFNEAHLRHMFQQCGMVVREALPSIPYNLQHVLGEPTLTRTYVCKLETREAGL
jgi:ubiquinone/menaquinone biosynthesis C-methylase UbiE